MTTRPRTPAPNTPAPGKLSLTELAEYKQRGQKIVMVTAYDAPSGRIADAAGVDIVLVGDSAAMTVLGHDSTVPATMEEMLTLVRATTRGARRPLVVADMPFGSFQVSDETALGNAIRFVKESGADAVKVEGAGPTLSRVRALVDAGVPVMGHIGLTPQSVNQLGSPRVQGKTRESAPRLLGDALAVQEAGAFAVVLEVVPTPLAAAITQRLAIPTIGIGAGAGCAGQVQVITDLLGFTADYVPKHARQYADLRTVIADALTAYAADVIDGSFPTDAQSFTMDPSVLDDVLGTGDLDRPAESASIPLDRDL